MADYSNQQRYLIDVLRRRSYDPEVLTRFLIFLKSRSTDEDIHPRLLDAWDQAYGHPNPLTFFPAGSEEIIEEIDNLLNSIRFTVDDELWNIRITEQTKTVFLLGAGASAPSGIPTVNGMFHELSRRARKIGRDDLDQLFDWCKAQRITNIEDLLTAAYVADFAGKNSSLTSLLDYFLFHGGREREENYSGNIRGSRVRNLDTASISFLQDTLQLLFSLLTSTMILANPNEVHTSIVKFFESHKNASIVTTNYDGCMDEAFLKANMPINWGISESLCARMGETTSHSSLV